MAGVASMTFFYFHIRLVLFIFIFFLVRVEEWIVAWTEIETEDYLGISFASFQVGQSGNSYTFTSIHPITIQV